MPRRKHESVTRERRHVMKVRPFTQRAGVFAALVAASMFVVPMASAHVHIGVGISVPGITVGVGNCWRCGYWAAPPVYYQPAYPQPVYPVYPAPVYYPAPAYYAPRPAYYGYYGPYYHRDWRRHGHRDWRGHGGYYHHHWHH